MPQESFTDAIAMLKADHRKVEELFESFEKARNNERKQGIVTEICNELKIHTMIEEEIFYPALRGGIEEDMLDEAYVEHDGAKVLVNDLASASPDEEYYDAKVSVLFEEIKHHVAEEERASKGMFAQARNADVDLKALRDQMMERKAELMQQAQGAGLPAAKPRAIHLVEA
jgi:serine phosphatase RsbU (regulator of sigma subunit)